MTIDAKENMLVLEEMPNLSRLADAVWTAAEPPKIHDQPPPQRAIMGFTHLQNE